MKHKSECIYVYGQWGNQGSCIRYNSDKNYENIAFVPFIGAAIIGYFNDIFTQHMRMDTL